MNRAAALKARGHKLFARALILRQASMCVYLFFALFINIQSGVAHTPPLVYKSFVTNWMCIK